MLQLHLEMLSFIQTQQDTQAAEMASKVQDKDGKPIEEGDSVWTPIRGGKRKGEVEQVVTTEEEAKEANAKHPPKVSIQSGYHQNSHKTRSTQS